MASPFLTPLDISKVTGVSPFIIGSQSLVTNLNSDLLDGQHGSYYLDTSASTQTKSGTLILGSGSSTGTAKLIVGGEILVGSSAIAQMNGFVRVDYIVSHNSGVSITPATNGQGAIGSTSMRFGSGFINSLTIQSLSASSTISASGTIATTSTMSAADYQLPIGSVSGPSTGEFSGPRSFTEIVHALSGLAGAPDPLRYRTLLNAEKWDGSAWSTDTLDWSTAFSGLSGYIAVITAAESSAGISAKRVTVDLGGDWRRPNLIFVQRAWDQQAWAATITVEKSIDNSTWSTVGAQSVSNASGLATFVQSDAGQHRYWRFTVQANVAITSGNLRIGSIRSLNSTPSANGTWMTPFVLGANRAVTMPGAITVQGAFTASSSATMGGTLGVSGAATLSSTLAVTGAATFSSTLTSGLHIVNGGDGAQANEYNVGLSVRGSDTLNRIAIAYDAANDRGTIAAIRAGVGWKDLCLQPIGGNVGIGGAAGGFKLQVTGTLNVTGVVTLGSNLTTSGSATFNGFTNHAGEVRGVSANGIAHSGNEERYYQVSKRLQATGHLGNSTILEIEAYSMGTGGYSGNPRRTTWLINTRDSISVLRVDDHGGVGSNVALRITDDTSVSNVNGSNNKYVVGVVCGVGTNFRLIYLRARFLEQDTTSCWSPITLGATTTTTNSGSAITYSSGWVANTGFSAASFTETIRNITCMDLSVAGASSFTGTATLSNKPVIQSSQPGIILRETDQGGVTHKWIDCEGGTFRLLQTNDAYDTFATHLTVSSSGQLRVHAGGARIDGQVSTLAGNIAAFVTPGIYSNGAGTGQGLTINSNSSFANQAAYAQFGLSQVSANANDLTAGVYLYVGGWYQNSGVGVPIRIGGGFTDYSSPGIVVLPQNASGNCKIGLRTASPNTGSYDIDGAGTFNMSSTISWGGVATTRKFSQTIGDGYASSFTITHNLNTQDVHVFQRRLSDNALVEVATSIVATSVNVVTVTFASPPTSNQYRITVIG